MTDDLLTRLRKANNAALPAGALWRLCDEAADEIERLRNALNSEAKNSTSFEQELNYYRDKAHDLAQEVFHLRARAQQLAQAAHIAAEGSPEEVHTAMVLAGLWQEENDQ